MLELFKKGYVLIKSTLSKLLAVEAEMRIRLNVLFSVIDVYFWAQFIKFQFQSASSHDHTVHHPN